MLEGLLSREGTELVLNYTELKKRLTVEQAQYQPKVGSHPHLVRQWLLACSVFPAKWLNRIFSVGGIRFVGEDLHLLAYTYADLEQDADYRAAKTEAKVGAPKIEVLYEDDHLLVANKPAGMPVHGANKGQRNSLDVAVAVHMLRSNDPIIVRHIHRLDDDTSGPVLYAKNELAQQRLDEQMRNKEIDRKYVAIVHGQLKSKKGTISEPIGKDRHQPKRRIVNPKGEHAVTHYELLESGEKYSVVKLSLETGRTHQIRVHMSHIRHPLVGDYLYGGNTELLSHQALHGSSLTFVHPVTAEELVIESKLPDWYAQIKQDITKS